MKNFSCPSCGAEMTARSEHVNLAVCPSCRTSILVDEKAAKISGKMAILALTPGPLFVQGTGKLGKRRFKVLGRVRYGYSAGFWDEWYLGFENGNFGWISEDEFNYTFEKRVPLESAPIDYASAEPGEFVSLGKENLHIDEKGIAICEGAEGELPFVVEQGEKVPYLDLSSGKIFATLEYDLEGAATLYHGRRLNLDRLQMDLTAEEMGLVPASLTEEHSGYEDEQGEQRERIVRTAGRSKHLNCFACGGSLNIPENPPDEISCEYCGTTTDLSLQACQCPNCSVNIPLHGGRQAKSLVCPSCKSQVDVTRRDKPRLLESLAASKRPKFPFKIGQQCTFDEIKFTLIGIVKYRQRDEGVYYYWTDFLLFNKEKGYRWLTLERDHFTLNYEVDERPQGVHPKNLRVKQTFHALDRKWKVFEVCYNGAEIQFVDGELPWVATIGDRNSFMDAIHPPYLLSAEWTKTEMEWSLSEYKTREEIAAAFKMQEDKLHKPYTVAPCQPSNIGPFRKQAMFIMWAVCIVNLLMLLFAFTSPGKTVGTYQLSPGLYKDEYLTRPFTIKEKNAICYASFEAPVDNSWVYLDVAIVDAKDNALFDYSAEMSYYHGYEGGESWSEGDHSDSKIFKLNEPGEYRLLVKGTGGTGDAANLAAARTINIKISEGVYPSRYFLILVVVALVWIAIDLWRRWSFETKRWAESGDDDD